MEDQFPANSTSKRQRTIQKPARYRDTEEKYLSTSTRKRRKTTKKPARSTNTTKSLNKNQEPKLIVEENKIILTEEEKYRRIRSINNKASRKSRQKQKQREAIREQEINELEQKNTSLRTKQAELIKQRDRMKTLCLEIMKGKITAKYVQQHWKKYLSK